MSWVFARINGAPVADRVVGTFPLVEHGRGVKVLKLAGGGMIRSSEGFAIDEEAAGYINNGNRDGMKLLISDTWREAGHLKAEGWPEDAAELEGRAGVLEEIELEVWGARP